MERRRKPQKDPHQPLYPGEREYFVERREFITALGAGAATLTLFTACGAAIPEEQVAKIAAPTVANPTKKKAQKKDSDADGILDVDDVCPNEPEDRDGWKVVARYFW